MAGKTQITVLLVGDSSGAQKALRDAAAAANAAAAETTSAADKIAGAGEKIGGSSPKVESFGASFRATFVEMGAAAATGAKAAELVIDSLRDLGQSVGEYNQKMAESSATILGVTKSQDALAAAMAYADQQVKAGRSAYSDTVAAIAELTPTAKRANIDVLDLYHTVQLLSALNSGPEGGVKGAVVAINNALTGQFTSLQDRFNMSTTGIQTAIKAGIPPLEAINAALAKEGVTMDLVNQKSALLSNQTAILKDSLVRVAAEALKPMFSGMAGDVENLNKQLNDTDSTLHKLGDILGAYGAALDAVGAKAGEFGAQVGLAFLKALQALDLGNEGLNQEIARREKLLADAEAKSAAAAGKVAESTAQGFKPTAAQSAAVTSYGSTLLGAYVKGLDPTGQTIFGDLQKVVQDSLKAASPDGKVDDNKLRTIMPLLAQLSDEVARTGAVSEETWHKVEVALGGESPEIRTLIADYQALAVAKADVAAATAKVRSAEATQREDSKAAAGEAAGWVAQIKTARDNQAAADKAEAANIKGLQAAQRDLGQEQKASAQAGTDALRELGEEQKALAASGVAALGPINTALKEAQTDGAAVALGYKAQNDELQRQIDLNNQIVGQLEHQRDVKFLSIDERLAEIGKSRDQDDLREAATLRRERAQIERNSKPQIDLERERATVANYGLSQEQKGIADKAKASADANAATVAGIQAQIEKQTAANKVAQDGIQAQIDKQTEANRVAADGWQKRLDAQQRTIDAATADAAARHQDDQDRIDGVQTLADNSAAYWAKRAEADAQSVTDAQSVETAAKGTQTAAEGTLTAWQKTIDALAAAGLLGKRPDDQKPTIDENPGGDQAVANEMEQNRRAHEGINAGGGAGSAPYGPPKPGTPAGAPADYAGPGPNPMLYIGTDGQLHPYAPGSGGGYQIPDGNSGGGGSGSGGGSTTTQQEIHINAYGVGEADFLDKLTGAIQRVSAA